MCPTGLGEFCDELIHERVQFSLDSRSNFLSSNYKQITHLSHRRSFEHLGNTSLNQHMMGKFRLLIFTTTLGALDLLEE